MAGQLSSFHEAGHLIAYVELGIPFKKAWTADPKDAYSALIECIGDMILTTTEACEESAVLSLAGPFAQRRYAPNSHWEFGAGHHGTIHGVPQYGPASDLDFFWRDIFRIIKLGPQDNGARTRAWRDGLVEKTRGAHHSASQSTMAGNQNSCRSIARAQDADRAAGLPAVRAAGAEALPLAIRRGIARNSPRDRGASAMNVDRITPIVMRLAELFPQTFAVYEQRTRPLAVGIRAAISERVVDAITPDELNAALRAYTRNVGYQKSASAARRDAHRL